MAMPLSLDIWSRNKLCKRGCQSNIGCGTNGLSDQWAVEPMGCRTNGLSNQWAVRLVGRNHPFLLPLLDIIICPFFGLLHLVHIS